MNNISQGKLRKNYKDFEEFRRYDEIYNLASRLKYKSAATAWRANPTIQWSIDPQDYKKVK